VDEESKSPKKISGEDLQFHKRSARKNHEEAPRSKPVDGSKRNGPNFQAIFEQAPVGMAQLSLEGRFLRVNRRLAKIWGYSRKELPGLRLAQVIFPGDSFLVRGLESESVESRFVRKDGSLMWARVSAEAVGEAEQPGFFIAVVEDITDYKQGQEDIKARLREKETQIQEIHHRVKNNMQVLSSLLNLYRLKIKDEQVLEAIRECQNRIMAMALVHEVLCQSRDRSRVELKEYIGKLAQGVWASYGGWNRVGLFLNLEPINLNLGQAVPLGLALNELLSNSLKHGFPDGRPGQVQVQVGQPAPGLVEVVVQDDGVGLGQEADWRNSESLGLKLLVGLIERQLGGTVDMEEDQGTKFTIRFESAGTCGGSEA